MKKILFFFSFLVALNFVFGFPIGITPATKNVCVCPNETDVFYFKFISESDFEEMFEASWEGPNWTFINITKFYVGNHSYIDFPIYTNVSNETNGNGTLSICYIPKEKKPLSIAPCIKAKAYIAVSYSCCENESQTMEIKEKTQKKDIMDLLLLILGIVLIFIAIMTKRFKKM